MSLSSTFRDFKTIAVVCMQWGDTGKGKLVDCLAEWAQIVARGTGGANAGHTIFVGGREIILHLVPSGILWPSKINVIGRGVALDPHALIKELQLLQESGIDYADRLFISLNTKLVLPQHVVMDRIRESAAGDGKIGTTGRGIGPAYEDYYRRIGLTVNDLLNPLTFEKKLRRNLEEKVRLLSTYDPQLIEKIMRHADLGEGRYYSPNGFFNVDAILYAYLAASLGIQPMVRDTEELIKGALGNKRIILEGAQGNLLSVDYGTYPYVTASDCSIYGLAKGVGITPGDVDLTLGVVKAFYMTRVGAGPFPTEIGGKRSEEWCAEMSRAKEEFAYPYASIEATDEFELGVAIRRRGREYGATTGRSRRVGWLDLPLLRYSAGFTGGNVAITKLDVLDECPRIRICTAYRYQGPDYWYGSEFFTQGRVIEIAVPSSEILRHCEPIYEEFPGWLTDISGITVYDSLPGKLKEILAFIEKKAVVKILVLSVGKEREKTIFR